MAVADEVRKLRPDLEIDWLAQHPVTALLEAQGERIHPASRFLANESAHIVRKAMSTTCTRSRRIRRMDEILLANFGVFEDLMTDEHYDVVIADEAWELDYFLHENPELKRTSFVWMTDFVGWLPMTEGGAQEAALTADYNAEMLEQVERFRRVRDRSIFVGDPDDIVPDAFGPDMPAIRELDRAALRLRRLRHRLRRHCVRRPGGAAIRTRIPARRTDLHRDRRWVAASADHSYARSSPHTRWPPSWWTDCG